MRVTICGSFRRSLPDIERVVRQFRSLDVEILSPRSTLAVESVQDFVRLEGDSGSDKDIESRHLESITQSDFIYVVNPQGYIGASAGFEIGFAVSQSVPVYLSEIPVDPIHGMFAKLIGNAKEALKHWMSSEQKWPRRGSLARMQSFYTAFAKDKGFSKETPRDTVLLLVEEIGELAKAIRVESGLKHDAGEDRRKLAGEEMADCFFYLLHLSNVMGLDLAEAADMKMGDNIRRSWRSSETPVNALWDQPALEREYKSRHPAKIG